MGLWVTIPQVEMLGVWDNVDGLFMRLDVQFVLEMGNIFLHSYGIYISHLWMIYDDGHFFMAMLNYQRVSIYDGLIKNHWSLPKSHGIQHTGGEGKWWFHDGHHPGSPDTPRWKNGVLKRFFKDRQQQRFNDFHNGKSRIITCEFYKENTYYLWIL